MTLYLVQTHGGYVGINLSDLAGARFLAKHRRLRMFGQKGDFNLQEEGYKLKTPPLLPGKS